MALHLARLHGPTAASRRVGINVRTIRRWRALWREGGLAALVPRYPRHRGRRVSPLVIELVGQARRELAYGAKRTQLWPRRVHDIRVAMGTVQRIFRDLRLPRLRRTRKRVPPLGYMELIIGGLDLPPGKKRALLTKLRTSREHLEAGNSRAARTMLSAFIQQIKANPGGRLNRDQIDGLVSMAELRIDAIDDAATAEAEGVD